MNPPNNNASKPKERRLLTRTGVPAPKPPTQLADVYNKIGVQELAAKHADATLGGGNLRDVVRLPHGEDINEWLAINISDFFNQVSLLFGMVSEQCTAETCPTMRAGQNFEYYWSDGDNLMKCAAPVYIDYLLTSVRLLIEDETTFPSQIGKPFPSNFLQISKTIMKRLFRVYAHTYHEHFEFVKQLKAIEHLNTSFKHFILFIQEFQLIETKDLTPLDDLIQKLMPSSS